MISLARNGVGLFLSVDCAWQSAGPKAPNVTDTNTGKTRCVSPLLIHDLIGSRILLLTRIEILSATRYHVRTELSRARGRKSDITIVSKAIDPSVDLSCTRQED